MSEFIRLSVYLVVCIAIGAAIASYFYYYKKKDLFGGYIGGLVVGTIGALIIGYILDMLFYNIMVTILDFLSRGAGIDIIACVLGGYTALYIMNRLNHDRNRKKY